MSCHVSNLELVTNPASSTSLYWILAWNTHLQVKTITVALSNTKHQASYTYTRFKISSIRNTSKKKAMGIYKTIKGNNFTLKTPKWAKNRIWAVLVRLPARRKRSLELGGGVTKEKVEHRCAMFWFFSIFNVIDIYL